MKEAPIAPKRVSALLASPAYGGTLSAVRCLGRHGIIVNVISSKHHRPSAAAWSRHVQRCFFGPRENEHDRFVERLLAIGTEDPGQLLLPTSDETAWVYSKYASELAGSFRLLQPPLQTIRRILDKKLLADAANRAGLITLPSWEPTGPDEVARLAPDLPYPILIKRRTHVLEAINHKGVLVHASKDLPDTFAKFLRTHTVHGRSSAENDGSFMPFLQQFASGASDGVCSISGFIDRTGELFVTRRSAKVYQRSHPIGVGVCFEPRNDDPGLSSAVRALCAELGYFGIFEVEFIRFKDSWAVIDFNPRLFNQIALDIRRGMPLPWLACLEALGDYGLLRDAVAAAQTDPDHGKAVFCDRFTLRAILAARALTRRISKEDAAYWRSWLAANAAHTVDVAKDADDPLPGFVHMLSEIRLGLRAVPKFLRVTPKVSAAPICPSVDVRQ